MFAVELYFWPRNSGPAKLKAILNELTIILITYHLFCFTEFTDAEARSIFVGNSAIVCICLAFAINLFATLIPEYKALRFKCKHRGRLRKFKAMKKQVAA